MKKRVMALIVLLIVLVPANVYADFGPKPTLQVLVKNSRDEACFVTLACDPDTENPDPDKMYLYTDGNIYAYLYKDPSDIADSFSKCSDFFGMKKTVFGYYNVTGRGIPAAFYLVLQYESGDVVVSDLGTDGRFNGMVLFDAQNGSVEKITVMDREFYLLYRETILYMLLCVAITIVVEILISLPFKVKPLRILVLTNIGTQVLLHAALIATYRFFSFFIIFVFFIYEIIIWVIEYAIYRKFAKSLSGRPMWLYVLAANLVSMVLSIPAIINM